MLKEERKDRKVFEKKPLYRKINTCTHRSNHKKQKDVYERNTKEDLDSKSKMKKHHHGLDFSPLFAFLRKNVGKKWDNVKSEALTRLPKGFVRNDPLETPIISYSEYLDLCNKEEKGQWDSVFRYGESSYHSLMYVDENGFLQLVDPNLTIEDIKPSCLCCQYSFNGKKVPKPKEIK